jgi:hypothetical protein
MIPGKSFQIAGVVALSGILAAMFSASRESAPAPAQAAPLATRLEGISPDDFPLLKKQDRLPLPDLGPKPVATETVMVQPEAQIDVKKKAEPKKEKPTMVASVEHNICTAHHMRKIETHGGRSWRCRR